MNTWVEFEALVEEKAKSLPKIQLTEEQAYRLVYDQLDTLRWVLRQETGGRALPDPNSDEDPLVYPTEDDGGDDVSSALDLAHSLYEAVVFGAGKRQVLEDWLNLLPGEAVSPEMEQLGLRPTSEYASGGGAVSPLVQEMSLIERTEAAVHAELVERLGKES